MYRAENYITNKTKTIKIGPVVRKIIASESLSNTKIGNSECEFL